MKKRPFIDQVYDPYAVRGLTKNPDLAPDVYIHGKAPRQFNLFRYYQTPRSTSGILLRDDERLCFVLEPPATGDHPHIPDGRYRLRLRQWGDHHERYSEFYGPWQHEHYGRNEYWHRGMVEVCDVPHRTDILLHKGNRPENTDGCPLVGAHPEPTEPPTDWIGNSRTTYERVYPVLADAIVAGETWLEIKTLKGIAI